VTGKSNAINFGKVAVLLGGLSAEREVSLKSGNAVLAALKRQGVNAHGIDAGRDVLTQLAVGKFDRAFIVLHGRGGEDGTLQGALELLGLPYTGSGVLGSALGMDKLRCKLVWSAAGIPVADYVVLTEGIDLDGVAQRLGFPIFVKPACEGSSIGISKARTRAELEQAWALAAKYDRVVLAERFIDGAEVTCGMLGERALPLVRIETTTEFYDYEAKYTRDDTRYHCPSGLDAALEYRLQDLARRAFDIVGCGGWGRVDFMLDTQGNPYVLEINSVPGMTDHSLVPKAAQQAGIGFDELCLKILMTSIGETSDATR
jgi:D-alanine-D-alanine ligase